MDCRSFVRQSASGATGLTLASSIPSTVLGANDRLRLGLIGCGSRGNFLLQQSRRRNPGLCPQCGHTPILIAATKRHKDAFVEKSMATVVDHVGSGARWRVCMEGRARTSGHHGEPARAPQGIPPYATRLGNNRPVPEVIFHGTRGTFDTQTWTARGEGGGADALVTPVVVRAPEAIVDAPGALDPTPPM